MVERESIRKLLNVVSYFQWGWSLPCKFSKAQHSKCITSTLDPISNGTVCTRSHIINISELTSICSNKSYFSRWKCVCFERTESFFNCSIRLATLHSSYLDFWWFVNWRKMKCTQTEQKITAKRTTITTTKHMYVSLELYRMYDAGSNSMLCSQCVHLACVWLAWCSQLILEKHCLYLSVHFNFQTKNRYKHMHEYAWPVLNKQKQIYFQLQTFFNWYILPIVVLYFYIIDIFISHEEMGVFISLEQINAEKYPKMEYAQVNWIDPKRLWRWMSHRKMIVLEIEQVLVKFILW